MTNLLLILLLLVGCESIREEIVERHPNGDKKLLVKYKGKGSDEIVIERVEYNEKGDTILYERPLEKIHRKRNNSTDGYYTDVYNNNGLIKTIMYREDGRRVHLYHSKVINDKSIKDGLGINYFLNGNKESEGNYKNNVKDGEWKYYDESNEYLTIINWTKGEAFVELYHNNGQLKERGKVINGYDYVGYNYGIHMGKYEKYFEDGKIHTSYFVLDTIHTSYTLGDDKKIPIIKILYKGDYLSHYSNGQIYKKGSYDDKGKPIGLHEEWWQDGTKDIGVEYKNGKAWDGFEYLRDFETLERNYLTIYTKGKSEFKFLD